MELKRVYMQNFLAVGEDAVEINLDQKGGITVIKGNNKDVSGKSSNGSGKSTIIEAIFFGLTGKTLRKLNQEGIIHNASKGKCHVEIDYDNVRIVRKLKPNSVKLFVDGKDHTTASTKETNKLIDSMVGVNFETLSNILIFGQHNLISFLDAGEPEKREIIENLMNLKEYNQYEQSAREQLKEAKSKFKGLSEKHNIYLSHLEEQKKLLADQEASYEDFISRVKASIQQIDNRISSTPDIKQLQDAWKKYNLFLDEKKKLDDTLSGLSEERNKQQQLLNNAVEKRNTDSAAKQPLVEKVHQIKGMHQTVETRKKELHEKQIVPLEVELDNHYKLVAADEEEFRVETESLKAQYSKKIEETDVQLNVLREMVRNEQSRIASIKANELKDDDVCPTCYGKVDSKNADKLIESIQKNVDELVVKGKALAAENQAAKDEMSRKLRQIEEQANDRSESRRGIEQSIRKKIEDARADVDQKSSLATERISGMLRVAEKELEEFDSNIESKHGTIISDLQDTIKTIEDRIVEVNRNIDDIQSVQRPEIDLEQIGSLQARLENDKALKLEKEKELENNGYIGVIQQLKKSIEKVDNDVKNVVQQIKDVESQLPYFEFWVSHMGSSGLKSFAVEQIIPTLNEQIEYWMQIIYQGAITVKFDKYFNVSMINNASNNEMIFGQGSGGERRRIDIAIMLAFRQVMKMSTGKDPNILFLDECLENLDEEGVYRFFDALQEMAKTSHIYMITHNPTMLSLLQNNHHINVSKKNGAMSIS